MIPFLAQPTKPRSNSLLDNGIQPTQNTVAQLRLSESRPGDDLICCHSWNRHLGLPTFQLTFQKLRLSLLFSGFYVDKKIPYLSVYKQLLSYLTVLTFLTNLTFLTV